MKLEQMNQAQLQEQQAKLQKEFDRYKEMGLSLNMARGKPSPAQLDLSAPLFDILSYDDYKAADGTDVRNYGVMDGLPEAKQIFADFLGMEPANIIIGGSASLNLMWDVATRAMLKGVLPDYTPWCKLDSVKFLCPSPGYDRHFTICQTLGIEMIPVPMLDDGPDMDVVENLVAADASIKGIWCVPMYSNPEGVTYSDTVVRRLAAMPAAAADFRIFWDNAYGVHHLDMEDHDHLLNIYQACQAAGNPDRVYIFASTSKITFAGAGISAMAASPVNIAYQKKLLNAQTISYDKVNQLRHVRFLKNFDGLMALMAEHAKIMKPKFDLVNQMLERELGGLGCATWKHPKGGYFVSVDVMDGCAKRVVALCKEAGVVLTGAGATFPYGKDPRDRNIRLAPSYPGLDELEKSMELFCLAVKLAAVEKLLG